MKTIARFALLFLVTCGTAAADAFTPENLPADPYQALTPPAVPKTLSAAVLEVTGLESAASRSFDYEREGYIGTVLVSDGFGPDTSSNLPTSTVPEPASLVLLGSGLALAALRRRRA